MFNELTGEKVRIVPMERHHVQGLYEIGQEKLIWEHLPKTIHTQQDMRDIVEEAIYNRENSNEFPWVILLQETDEIIGTTRFLDVSNIHKGLEIGWTWYATSVWGININTECKYLLLKYCFETLKFIRVQFKTDHQNIRSQRAIEKIGGVKEGVLRNHMIRKDGTFRHSVFYSITLDEWAGVKDVLEKKLGYK